VKEEKIDILYEKDIRFLHLTGFPDFFFLIAQVLAILLEYVLVDHTEIDIGTCLVRPIVSYFGFWYSCHFSCVIFFTLFSILPILPSKM